jgi:site-specific DNA recombinase
MSDQPRRKRAGPYIRVSTEEQAREGYSLAEQERELRALCDAKGWECVDVYVDGGRHGDFDDQRELQRLLADVDAGKIDVVPLKALDRLGRTMIEVLGTLARFDGNGVEVFAGGRQLDRESPEGGLHTHIEAIFAEYERAKIRKRTRDNIREARAAGKPWGGLPFGYRLEPVLDERGAPVMRKDRIVNGRVVDRHDAAIVNEMFATIENAATPGEVAVALNARGVRTVRGSAWTRDNVGRLLHHRSYLGENGYPQIVSPERWQAVQDQLDRRDPVAAQRRQGGRRGGADFILRGIAFCRPCGAPFYTRADHGRRYQCRDARRGTGLCDAPPIPADVLERHVLNHLDTFIGSVEGWLREQAAELSVAQHQREAAIDDKRKTLAKIQTRRARHLVEYEKLVAADSPVAYVALEVVAKIDAERDQQARMIADDEAVAAEWGAPVMDAALDYYNRIVDVIHGRVRQAQGTEALNRALASVLAGLWVELEVDRDRLIVEFALHDQPAVRLPGGVDVLPAFRREREWLPPASLSYQPLEPRPFEPAEPSHQRSSTWRRS